MVLDFSSDARGFFTGKKTTLFFTGFLTGFFTGKNTSVYVTLTMLIKYSVYCRVQCTALLEMS